MALSKAFFNFLKKYNTENNTVNCLIVSNYLYNKKTINIKNTYIKSLYQVSDDLIELNNLGSITNFEELIEAFEFVISPSTKIVNGAVYTPKFIRDFIVEKTFAQKNNNEIPDIKIGDISCGCGGFLLTAAEKIYKKTNKSFYEIFENNIFGIDIEEHSVERSKILLSLLAIEYGEDSKYFKFNLYQGNSLDFDWRKKNNKIKLSNGFDIIIGNPPYVCSRNMDTETLEKLKKIEVSKTGHPDLYIPFFQIGIENLNSKGILGYITVNTFLKSINGRALRDYFKNSEIDLTIINFGGEQLFKDRNTYTCICFILLDNPIVKYIRTESQNINKIKLDSFKTYLYNELNNFSGWNLVNDESTAKLVRTVENIGEPFSKVFTTRNGIATLKNNIYKFTPFKEDDNNYYLLKDKIEYKIEKSICRNIVNANKIKKSDDIKLLNEKIIFPYDSNLKIISEDRFIIKYPNAYEYLCDMREILSTRDKSNGKYEEWYAYGRRQSLDIDKFKLFFAHISKKPKFIINLDKDLLFYNGIAVISDSKEELMILKKILESDIFYKYISNVSKDYSSGFISFSKNYLKNFGICNLNEQEKQFLLEEENKELLNIFFKQKYQI
ncbi:class I SAM-dependent DNA methyltransferase [Chryseobacterium viscerum]|uniref:HsdM family class I SAM-dependent methyltransferase n=1 Tax=Chryseobacterium viscerum TaxID=1037377 RepID=UPI002221A726|nr:DNA methyltransferase [Chryseobacterium viscerum]MCW1961426.1 N-6 DNA methylase [Chryseobacterium viscerum]